MAGEWKRVTVAEVCELIVDCVNKTAPVVEGLTPFKMLRTTNIKGGRIDRQECRRVAKETFVKWTRRADVRRGDVILTREAPLGEVGYVDFDDTVFLGQRLMQYRANPALLDPRFLLYSFLSKDLQNQFGAHEGSGSTVSHIRVGDCSKFHLSLPPLAEQKAIAAVLGALDDKIELSRRMNATLEAMAQAIFQSWFVDFNPVRAKLDGRQPVGIDQATADLFPDSFQDSELGHIPKGWRVGRVAEVSDFSRSSIKPGDFPDETFDHYSLPSFDEGRTPKSELGSAIMSNKLVVTPNSVLLSKLNPHIPRIWLPELSARRRSVCSTEFIVASTCSGFSREFLFSLFTSSVFATTYATLVTGTTGSHQRIRPESVLEIKIVIPSPKLVEAFTSIAKPMFDQINRNIEQSRALTTLRNTLLPKLLSGELRVPKAMAA